jgi:polyhydroxybutyrate depolymerase
MKKNLLAILVMLLCAIGVRAALVNKAVEITVNGETRTYWLYVPNNVQSNAALVVSLHGASNSMTNQHPMRPNVADKEGFIVVYPQGKEIYFPVFGGSVTGWDASGAENEDVDFIRAVVEDVKKNYSVDSKRIYCCGFSNGGMMTYALTNTCSTLFAAYASISGFPLNEFHFRHTGERPVPFLHIHGKADDFVKYSCMPIIVDEMVARLGANPVPEKTRVSGKYDKSVYAAGEGSFPYVYYEVDGMGHNDFTSNTPDNNSAQTMWNFFKQYTLDDPCDMTLRWRPRLETEGYKPKEHGWYVNTAKNVLLFGIDQHKSDNSDNNVYRSFQIDNGLYKLCFHADGETGKTVTVTIKKLTGTKPTVLNATVEVGKDIVLPFRVEDGWGEYRFTMTRTATTDQITITNLGLYTTTEEEVTALESPVAPSYNATASYYNLAGMASVQPQRGVNLVRRESGEVKKMWVR